ncbi:hypothetical protein SEA_LTON_61 [Gordonia phage Lton]|uniref:Uncharacterized protein n=1 Tax=Gordonia phage Lucky10 TaxID=1821557 RepID=A0A142KB21_9CAUD|nr:hypothetical protein BJD62_gp61 [Gordonia phage Lucky10]AMS03304.1 hypothetical protein SEA_LUCKY10_61 [Gordonia phage Lucky10]UXE05034.1 hypothetical protein SEA_LTON_61 [Gordonia phage Lton]UYL87820.1 hypothetical protein SEA_ONEDIRECTION_58 [Gordonia phage OneDirection]
MTDLLQVVEFGNQMGDQPIVWDGHIHQYLVPASNRRRILDREHSNGITAGGDGWLTFGRDLEPLDGVTLRHWTRIRWDSMPHLETQELP